MQKILSLTFVTSIRSIDILIELVRAFLDHGALTKFKDSTLLTCIAQNAIDVKIRRLNFTNYQDYLDYQDPYILLVHLVFEYKTDLTFIDKLGNTALSIALTKNNFNISLIKTL